MKILEEEKAILIEGQPTLKEFLKELYGQLSELKDYKLVQIERPVMSGVSLKDCPIVKTPSQIIIES